jgi:hypothetical protein
MIHRFEAVCVPHLYFHRTKMLYYEYMLGDPISKSGDLRCVVACAMRHFATLAYRYLNSNMLPHRPPSRRCPTGCCDRII